MAETGKVNVINTVDTQHADMIVSFTVILWHDEGTGT